MKQLQVLERLAVFEVERKRRKIYAPLVAWDSFRETQMGSNNLPKNYFQIRRWLCMLMNTFNEFQLLSAFKMAFRPLFVRCRPSLRTADRKRNLPWWERRTSRRMCWVSGETSASCAWRSRCWKEASSLATCQAPARPMNCESLCDNPEI